MSKENELLRQQIDDLTIERDAERATRKQPRKHVGSSRGSGKGEHRWEERGAQETAKRAGTASARARLSQPDKHVFIHLSI